ncbi:MAG TPA: DUF2298 domain-containing protein, partial [Anaerolineales bacterium]|nr:DUF2298 domain-containing protein [Anaerolineales bacterium]
IASALLYLPFYFTFSSQAGGLLPNIVSPTRGSQLWVMFAPLFLPLLAHHIYLWRGERRPAKWRLAIRLTLGLVAALLVALLFVAGLAALRQPGLATEFLQAQGAPDIGLLVGPALLRRLAFLGGLLTMLAVLSPALAFLIAIPVEASMDSLGSASPAALGVGPGPTESVAAVSPDPDSHDDRAGYFILLLVLIASLLVIGPEFVYLRDQFGSRMNTIFKFYFQAWLLWSLAAAMAVVRLLRHASPGARRIVIPVLAAVLMISMTYPVLAVPSKTNNLKPFLGWTLDDFKRIERGNPEEAAAILWLKSVPDGVVAEAVGGSYSEYGRISVYTGLPTVLGWPGHEVQWRGSAEPQGSRQDDVKRLYETTDWETARLILEQYDIRYVVVGQLERSTYALHEEKFLRHLNLVFQRGAVSVYEQP